MLGNDKVFDINLEYINLKEFFIKKKNTIQQDDFTFKLFIFTEKQNKLINVSWY
jgi:hypothetical protein